MLPALIGAGVIIKSIGDLKANADQAEAERANASFYREQADFARISGDRKQLVFDRQSVILEGDQLSAFAKAGSDMKNSAIFMAKSELFRQQESSAIKVESDLNVRLAMLRADQAEKTANDLEGSQLFGLGSNLLLGAGAVLK